MVAPRIRSLVITLGSLLLVLGLRLAWPQTHSYGDLSGGSYTDHFSHMNAARLFLRVGTDIWRKPINRLLPLVSEQQKADLPVDIRPAAGPHGEVYSVPGWPLQKPIIASWSENPRNYPPGDMLLVAPVAVLYHFTSLSFGAANRLLIFLFLCYAHTALYFFIRGAVSAEHGERRLRILVAVAAYGYIVYFTLQGFYDAAAVAPLLLCADYLQQRRGLPALLCYCAAAAVHFRAYFLCPWALYAAWLIVRNLSVGGLRNIAISEYVGAVVAGVLAFMSLYPFALLWPSLRGLPINNPINIHSENFHVLWLLGVGVLWGGAAWCFARARAYLDLAVLIVLAGMAISLHQAYSWHGIVPLAWVAAPLWGIRGASGLWVLGARLWSLLAFILLVLILHPVHGLP